MKTNLVRAALLCLAFVLPATAAFATGESPISGTDVGLEHDPAGIVAKGTTDRNGKVTFRDLKPGKYVLVFGGKGSAISGLPAGSTIRAEIGWDRHDATGDTLFSVETCACHTDQPTRIIFTLPQSGTVTLQLEYGDPRIIGAGVGAHF